MVIVRNIRAVPLAATCHARRRHASPLLPVSIHGFAFRVSGVAMPVIHDAPQDARRGATLTSGAATVAASLATIAGRKVARWIAQVDILAMAAGMNRAIAMTTAGTLAVTINPPTDGERPVIRPLLRHGRHTASLSSPVNDPREGWDAGTPG